MQAINLELGIMLNKRTIIDHSRIKSTPLMENFRRNILDLSFHDEALFHVTMSHSVASWSLLTKRGDPSEGLRHRTAAVKVIIGRLEDQQVYVSDGTIGAIAAMACYEVDSTATETSLDA